MGLASCIAKCLIILINVIFMILGLVFTALGVVLRFGAPWVSAYIQPMLSSIFKALEDNLPGAKIDINGILSQVFEVTSSVAIVLLILGIFFLALAITGCCGVCCSSKILLTVFCCISGAMLIAVATITLWTYFSKDAMVKIIKTPLEGILKKYKGAGSFDTSTLMIDLMNLFLDCCGINNGSDFNDVNWNKRMNFTIQGQQKSIELAYPLSCCKVDASKKPIDANCTFEPTLNNSNYDTGCWNKLTGGVLGYFSYLNFALFGICGLFLVLLTLGILAILCDKDNKVDSV